MRKKGFKGRCEKRVLGKSKEVCRTYDAIQSAYANWLESIEFVDRLKPDALQLITRDMPIEQVMPPVRP